MKTTRKYRDQRSILHPNSVNKINQKWIRMVQTERTPLTRLVHHTAEMNHPTQLHRQYILHTQNAHHWDQKAFKGGVSDDKEKQDGGVRVDLNRYAHASCLIAYDGDRPRLLACCAI